MMSLQIILKNIYSYLEVLQTAHTDSVSQWDEESLDHALKWATYCEQIYRQAAGKPYRDDLDKQIQQLGKLPWAHGGLSIHLELLCQASTRLKQALLQNPHLSSQLFNLVLTTYTKQGPDGVNKLLEDISPACADKAALELSQCLVACLDNSQPAAGFRLTSEAQMLLNYIDSVINKDHNKRRTEKLLHQKLSRIWEDKSGKKILLTALTLPAGANNSVEGENMSSGHHFLLLWLLNDKFPLEKSSESYQSMWNIPRSLLGQVSAIYFKFFTRYIQHLVKWGNSLIPVYHDGDQEKLISVEWRCKDDPHTSTNSFEDLQSHWQALVLSPKVHVADAARRIIISMTKQEEAVLWKEILIKLDKQSSGGPGG